MHPFPRETLFFDITILCKRRVFISRDYPDAMGARIASLVQLLVSAAFVAAEAALHVTNIVSSSETTVCIKYVPARIQGAECQARSAAARGCELKKLAYQVSLHCLNDHSRLGLRGWGGRARHHWGGRVRDLRGRCSHAPRWLGRPRRFWGRAGGLLAGC